MLNNQKGAVIELIAVFVVLLLLSFVFLLGNYINTNIQNDSAIVEMKNTNNYSRDIFRSIQYNYDATDNVFAMIYFALTIGAIILSFMVRSHPVFAAMGFIVLVVIMVFVPTISNAFEEISSEESFVTVSLPKTTFIMTNLPYLLLGTGFIIMIALYGVSNRL